MPRNTKSKIKRKKRKFLLPPAPKGRLPHFWRWFFTSFSSIIIGLAFLIVTAGIFIGRGDIKEIDFMTPLFQLSLLTAFLKLFAFILNVVQFCFVIFFAMLLSAGVHYIWWYFYERYRYKPEEHTRGYYLRHGFI